MASLTAGPEFSSPAKRTGGRFDGWLLLSALLLMIVGFMAVYSEGAGHGDITRFRKQIQFAALGAIPFFFFLLVPIRAWLRSVNFVYLINVAALLSVILFGTAKKGAERWIVVAGIQVQPSELAKLLFVLTLASFFATRQNKIKSFSTVALSLVHLGIPMALLLKQPHLGAAMVFGVAWFTIAFVAGVPGKFLALIAVSVLLLGVAVVKIPGVRSKVLTPYQISRLLGYSGDPALMTPEEQKELRNKNYQTDQAAIAFGLGGLTGRGYMKGEQKESRAIPEQYNDFVFTVPGEEAGLVGCALILSLFAFFFFRVWLVAVHATEAFSRMIAGGVFAVLVFHTFVNIAMVLKLVPVVGLWLPFLSSGVSALWLCLGCVGLLLNLRRQESPILF